ncbi:uncharacterized protein LOC128267972 [Anopheles cruzii]|uniref:uncharacterized protein LOC128267972 n=1 Tax=Anopheles cruzii TaxID=68878 RepID=UPI0022EC93C4|nr:uncharacterized protein LOC128267972 [Anopheles cruzii]
MIRALLPVLAYMSLLPASSYSLHMARDAYIKPPPPPPPANQLLDELDDMSELLAAENRVDLMRPATGVLLSAGRTMLGPAHQKLPHGGGGGSSSSGSNGGAATVVSGHHQRQMGASNSNSNNNLMVTSNELPELSPPPAHLPAMVLRHGPIGPLVGQPPRGLQELFGVQTNFDIRAAQQQQQQLGSSSSSSMDDRDEDDGGGGGGAAGGGEEDDGVAPAGTDAIHQRSASAASTNSKRASPNGGRNKMMADSGQESGSMPSLPHGVANQMMLRSTRGQRQYDVPQIECPPAMDGMERFACPTPDRQGRYRCIDDHVLCDGFIDCPEGEDEDRQACMFYKTTKAHLDVLADALLRWARGR